MHHVHPTRMLRRIASVPLQALAQMKIKKMSCSRLNARMDTKIGITYIKMMKNGYQNNSHPKTSQYSIYNQFILHTQSSGWINLYNLLCFLEACTDNSSEACAVISCLRLSVCELLHHKSRILHVLGLNRRSLPPQCITKLFLTLWNLGTRRRFTKSIWHTCMILP